MSRRLRNGWGRRAYLWLTTSPRDHRNRADYLGGHLQAARRERDKIQEVNDVLHSAGRGRRHSATLEGITLQGKGEGLAWGFLIVPAAFVVLFLIFISQYRRSERLAQQRAAEEEWQRQLRESAAKNAQAADALRSAQEDSRQMEALVRTFAEEDALGAALEKNLTFIKNHLEQHPPPESS